MQRSVHANQLLDDAVADPAAVVRQGTTLAAAADRAGDPASAAVAWRAVAIAASYLSQMPVAVEAVDRGMAEARRSGDDRLIGQVATTAAGVLAWVGRVDEAYDILESALERLDGLDRSRALVQRASIAYKAARFSEALADLDAAEPGIRSAGDVLWTARLLNNRALVRAFMGQIDIAEAEMHEAHDRYVESGSSSAAAETIHNLGWLATRRGDLPTALELFDRSERRLEALHYREMGPFFLARCEALMTANLTGEARSMAARAVTSLLESGAESDRAEALLRLAEAALLDGAPPAALDAASEAAEHFRLQQRPGWAARAEFLALKARIDLGEAIGPSQLRSAATRLAEHGFTSQAIDARLLAADAAGGAGDDRLARALLAEAGRIGRAGDVASRLRGWLARARIAERRGDHGAAARAAARGIGEALRTMGLLGDLAVRAHFAGHTAELGEIGLRAAIRSGRPRRIFEWIERSRAAALRVSPVVSDALVELAPELATLRSLGLEVNRTDPASLPGRRLRAQHRAMEQRVLARMRTTRGVDITPGPGSGLDVLPASSRLIETAWVDGRLRGVTAVDGRYRRYDGGTAEAIGGAVDETRMAWARLMRRGASDASRSAAATLAEAAAGVLAGLTVPGWGHGRFTVLAPPPDLMAIPWSTLRPLSEAPLTVVPAVHTLRAAAPSRDGCLVVAGPRLESAASEARAVGAHHDGAVVLDEGEATVAGVLDAMDGIDVCHIAAHGQARWDSPMFSSLELHDGSLTVYDLLGLASPPRTVILSACESGVAFSPSRGETLGLVTGLLAAGVETVVASTGLVPDTDETARLMDDLHRALAAGSGVSEALWKAQGAARRRGDLVSGAAFLAFGRP